MLEVTRYFVSEMHASWMLKPVTLQGSGEEEVETQVGRDEQV